MLLMAERNQLRFRGGAGGLQDKGGRIWIRLIAFVRRCRGADWRLDDLKTEHTLFRLGHLDDRDALFLRPLAVRRYRCL